MKTSRLGFSWNSRRNSGLPIPSDMLAATMIVPPCFTTGIAPTISFTVVAMAMIGGSDTVRGATMGAAFLVLLSELLWANLPELYMILLGLLLIGFVLFAPGGLDGLLRRSAAR